MPVAKVHLPIVQRFQKAPLDADRPVLCWDSEDRALEARFFAGFAMFLFQYCERSEEPRKTRDARRMVEKSSVIMASQVDVEEEREGRGGVEWFSLPWSSR